MRDALVEFYTGNKLQVSQLRIEPNAKALMEYQSNAKAKKA
jgi:hypothetical protein